MSLSEKSNLWDILSQTQDATLGHSRSIQHVLLLPCCINIQSNGHKTGATSECQRFEVYVDVHRKRVGDKAVRHIYYDSLSGEMQAVQERLQLFLLMVTSDTPGKIPERNNQSIQVLLPSVQHLLLCRRRNQSS